VLTQEELEIIIVRELPGIDENDIWVSADKPKNKNGYYTLPDNCWYVTYPPKNNPGTNCKMCLSIDKDTGEVKTHFNLNNEEIVE